MDKKAPLVIPIGNFLKITIFSLDFIDKSSLANSIRLGATDLWISLVPSQYCLLGSAKTLQGWSVFLSSANTIILIDSTGDWAWDCHMQCMHSSTDQCLFLYWEMYSKHQFKFCSFAEGQCQALPTVLQQPGTSTVWERVKCPLTTAPAELAFPQPCSYIFS